MYKICRLCLFKIDNGEYKLSEESEIMTKFNSCLRLKLNPNEHFPKQICEVCHKKIEDIHKFRERVMQNELKLVQNLENNSLKSFFLQLADGVEIKLEQRTPKSVKDEEESQDSNHFDSHNFSAPHIILEIPEIKTDHELKKAKTIPKTISPDAKIKDKNTQNDPLEIDKTKHHIKSESSELDNTFTLYVLDRQKPFYKCNSCGYTYESKHEITKHVNLHKDEKPFICKLCGKGFKTVDDVVKHTQMHSRYKILCRHGCGFTTTYPGVMKEHEKKEHLEVGNERAENPSGAKLTLRRDLLAKDSVTDQLTNNKNTEKDTRPFGCSYCKKRFLKKANAKAHERIHTGEGWHLCSFCGKMFAQRSTLHRHQKGRHPREYYRMKHSNRSKIHSGMAEIIEYMCTECNFTCESQDILTVHLEEHDENLEKKGDKRLHCRFCGKAFGKRSGLAAHEGTHTGATRVLCAACGKTFSQQSTLRRHLKGYCIKYKKFKGHDKKIRRDGRYLCSDCGKTFAQINNLLKHQSTHHAEDEDDLSS